MEKVIKFKNKHYMLKNALSAILLAWLPTSLFSQEWVNSDHKAENLMGIKKGWFVGADFGCNTYYGAITSYNNIPKFKDFSKLAGYPVAPHDNKYFITAMKDKFGVDATKRNEKLNEALVESWDYFKKESKNLSDVPGE